jgi:hypothetical protein
MYRLQLRAAKLFVERRHAGVTEPRGDPRPLARHPVVELAELPEDVAAVRVERNPPAVVADLRDRPQRLETRPRVAEREKAGRRRRDTECVGDRAADEPLRAIVSLDGVRR